MSELIAWALLWQKNSVSTIVRIIRVYIPIFLPIRSVVREMRQNRALMGAGTDGCTTVPQNVNKMSDDFECFSLL